MIQFAGRIAPRLFAIFVAFWLAACSGNAVIVGSVDVSNNYSPLELSRYGSGGNELRVVVHGDPFGAGNNATAAAVVDAMQGNTLGTPVTFALEPAQEARPPSQVVIYLNPRQLVGAETLCNPASPITTTPSAGGKVVVNGAWCQTSFVITRAAARVGGADGLASERFRSLIGQLTIALFPPRNPHDDTRRGPCLPFCR